MDKPTFYLLKENYPEDELKRIIGVLEECGAKTVIVQNGVSSGMTKNLFQILSDHI